MNPAELQLDLLPGEPPAAACGAQQCLPFDDPPLPFRLRRSRRADVSLRVDEQGVRVDAPRGMTLPLIEQAIREGRRQLGGKLAGRGTADKLALPPSWEAGARVPFLGREIALLLDAGREGIVLEDDTLRLPLPPHAGEKQIKDSVQGWLQSQARIRLEEALINVCQSLGVPSPVWKLSFAAAGNWGGRDAGGVLRLSWRLVHLTPEEISIVLTRLLGNGPAAMTHSLWEEREPPAAT